MATIQEVLEAYGAAWNETDEPARRTLLERSWADDGVFIDPQSEVKGRDALVQLIADFQKQLPGAQILATSGVDEHHGRLRFTWKILGKDGAAVLEGIDFAELADDGRLRTIVGFWGPPPAVG